jgi:hypothetical protein
MTLRQDVPVHRESLFWLCPGAGAGGKGDRCEPAEARVRLIGSPYVVSMAPNQEHASNRPQKAPAPSETRRYEMECKVIASFSPLPHESPVPPRGDLVSTQLLGWWAAPAMFKAFAWWLAPDTDWQANYLGYACLVVLYTVSMAMNTGLLGYAVYGRNWCPTACGSIAWTTYFAAVASEMKSPSSRFSAASVTGPPMSIPFERILPPVSCFCPGSARGCHLMGSDEDRPANLMMRGPCMSRLRRCGLT